MREHDVLWSRWEEIDRIFDTVLEQPESGREAALRRECGDDLEIYAVLHDLLSSTGRDAPRVASPGGDLLRAAVPADGDPGKLPIRIGDRVGRYRIIGELGAGGMATVYEAERSDGVYRQTVALKVLRRGLDTDRIVERFIAERQILSDFDHPNVARLLDGGATADGRPFLVMEKVDGEPLTHWADARRADVRQRLELFLQVTDAVKEAHRRLVVHRDLKPSNILVDATGRVKLLDFGIAKLLNPSHGAVDLTILGVSPLTRRYASPEQLGREPVTASSDIYQLGLILFELLSGLLPFETEVAGATASGDASPPRPSQALTQVAPERLERLAAARASHPRVLARELRGDLDTIALKALEHDPQERYRSVDDLAGDVRRHLEGVPIRARPAPWRLRARKWAGRNPWAPPVAVVLLVGAVGYAATLTVTAKRLEAERNAAREAAERAEGVTEFLAGVFQVADPDERDGEDISALELLEVSAARAMTELEGQPLTQAAVLGTIGSMYNRRGLYDRALPLLERAVELSGEAGGDPVEHVRHLRRLATAARDTDRAIALLEEAAILAERELGPDHVLLAGVLTDLAPHLSRVGSPEALRQGRDMLERALVILRAQTGDVRAELAAALNLSAWGGDIGDLPRLEEALALRRSLYGENHTAVAGTLNDMALLLERHDPVAADTLLERAAAINESIHGSYHARTLVILNNLAGRYRDRGDFPKAEALYRDVLRRRWQAYPEDTVAHAYVMHGLGWSLTELGRPEEAEPMLRDVVRIVDPGPDRSSVVHQIALSTLGHALAAQGRYAEAEPLLRDSYHWISDRSPNAAILPFMLERLTKLYDAWGRFPQADEFRSLLLQWQRRTARQSGTGDAGGG